MSSYLYMRLLESVPARYDRGIALATFGGIGELYQRTADAAVPQPGARVLELGCGTGGLTRQLLARGAEVVALDRSAGMLAVARQALGEGEGRLHIEEKAAVELADGHRELDVVAASLVLSELGQAEQDAVLASAHRALRPGGRLVIADELPPEGLGARLVAAALRWPVAVLTWTLTQRSSHPVADLPARVQAAGFDLLSQQRLRRAGASLLVATRRPGPSPVAPLPALLRPPRGPDWLAELVETSLRLVAPIPTRTGVLRLGSPGPDSPVFLTGNYDLTVRRVLRALRGVDGHLLVADSRGINVWCASSGGHLSTHDVVTAVRLARLDERGVGHHKLVLPQLSATGVEARPVRQRSGAIVQFGPARAADLPAWLAAGRQADAAMRQVRFGLSERLEATVSWAAPVSLVALVLAWQHLLGALALVWLQSLAVFLLYDRLPGGDWLRRGLVGGIALALTLGLSGAHGWALLWWTLASLAVTATLTFDYAGATPTGVAGILEDRHCHIRLDLDACRGAWTCDAVCPEAVFERDLDARKVRLARPERCIRCGACVVQCPHDALAFVGPDGARIPPERIRRQKLNLLGKRG